MTEKQADYNTKAQTIFRVEKNPNNPYVMIDRRVIENPELSWKAKGLLAYLLSRPDNWTVRFKDLVKRSPDGAHIVRGAMKELRAAGHVKVSTVREGGRIKEWNYTVFESPDGDFQQVEKQQVENRTFNNKDSTKKNVKQQPEERPNAFAVYEQEIGIITPMIADDLGAWVDDVGEKWVTDAIREASKNNKRNWKYCAAILKRWQAQGSQEAMKKGGNGKQARPGGFDVIQSWLEKTTVTDG